MIKILKARLFQVAVLWNPHTSTFETSTVPKGPRRDEMINDREFAPIWLSAARSYINMKDPPLCAEDAVEYNVETTEDNGVTDVCEYISAFQRSSYFIRS